MVVKAALQAFSGGFEDELLKGEIALGGEEVVVESGAQGGEIVAEDSDEFSRVTGGVPG
jgi:hypothetical protein